MPRWASPNAGRGASCRRPTALPPARGSDPAPRWPRPRGWSLTLTSGPPPGSLALPRRATNGERLAGPIFVSASGRRLDRHGAGRIVRRVARRAGIDKHIGSHTLRHAFITAGLDAGVPLRDVQEAASHADPRTTMRYDRARVSLDRHATYIVATYIAGASR